ncbi:MAG: serine hydroxymethyltransferase [Phycisphaerae bacterium]|nr:serine hydroxymethyltransferase [Phycisphaerae bacterium]
MPFEKRYEAIRKSDPQMFDVLCNEERRQRGTLELIASENHVSRAVMEAAGSCLTNKYAEGYPGRRYYGGCQFVDQAETLALERLKQLFGADAANVQPHSGTQANTAVYMAVLQPGDTILSLDLAHGGHLTHGMKINISGLLYNIVHYGVDEKTERLDMGKIADLARQHKPKLIIAGASAYPRFMDFEAFAGVAREVGAVLMVDMAHIAGLVAAGEHPSPVPMSDFVTSTTHKTLRGPRGGLVLCKEQYAKTLNSRVFPGIQGGPLMHIIAAKAVAFGEALNEKFREYQKQVRRNAQALADALMSHGMRLVSGGTDTHLMLVDLRPSHPNLTGKVAEGWLECANIIVNKNMIPFDTRKPMETSGLRIGTPAVTTRGLKEAEMKTLAGLIAEIINSGGEDHLLTRVRAKVSEMCQQYPLAE